MNLPFTITLNPNSSSLLLAESKAPSGGSKSLRFRFLPFSLSKSDFPVEDRRVRIA
ncbi:MAG: hypothetical protein ACFFB0_21475 [Promethearchaeota archaeon]